MRCKLTLISTNHSETPVRDGGIEGFCHSVPQIEERCVVFHEYPDKPDLVRLVSTSPVRKIEALGNGVIRLETMNSVYDWESLTPAN